LPVLYYMGGGGVKEGATEMRSLAEAPAVRGLKGAP
jgi:hypothetical protein